MNGLDLALIGNCSVGALIDARASVVWGCFPRFDGAPVFCSLLREPADFGFFGIDPSDFERSEQAYLDNTAILQETPFFLEDTVTLLLCPDETVPDAVDDVGRRFFEETAQYWREWVRTLGIPSGWQEAVIRATITLKLNADDDTGAVIAAMTTSDPLGPGLLKAVGPLHAARSGCT